MYRSLRLIALWLFVAAGLTGCGSAPRRQWWITFENRAEEPCSVTVVLGSDASSKASVADVDQGQTVWMIAGSVDTVVQSISVLRGGEEQVLEPTADLRVGERYAIVVDSDGEATASLVDR